MTPKYNNLFYKHMNFRVIPKNIKLAMRLCAVLALAILGALPAQAQIFGDGEFLYNLEDDSPFLEQFSGVGFTQLNRGMSGIEASNGFLQGSIFRMTIPLGNYVSHDGTPATRDDFDFQWFHCQTTRNIWVDFRPDGNCKRGAVTVIDADRARVVSGADQSDSAIDRERGIGDIYVLNINLPGALPWLTAVAVPKREFLGCNDDTCSNVALLTGHVTQISVFTQLDDRRSRLSGVRVSIDAPLIEPDTNVYAMYNGGSQAGEAITHPAECMLQKTVAACGTRYPHGVSDFSIEWELSSVFIARQAVTLVGGSGGNPGNAVISVTIRQAIAGSGNDYLNNQQPTTLGTSLRLGDIYNQDKAITYDGERRRYFHPISEGENVSLRVVFRIHHADSFNYMSPTLTVLTRSAAVPAYHPAIFRDNAAGEFKVAYPAPDPAFSGLQYEWFCVGADGKSAGTDSAFHISGPQPDYPYFLAPIGDRYSVTRANSLCSYLTMIPRHPDVPPEQSNHSRFVGVASGAKVSITISHEGNGYEEGDVYRFAATFNDVLGDTTYMDSYSTGLSRAFRLNTHSNASWFKVQPNSGIGDDRLIGCPVIGSCGSGTNRLDSRGNTYTLRQDHMGAGKNTRPASDTQPALTLSYFDAVLADLHSTRIFISTPLPRNAPLQGNLNVRHPEDRALTEEPLSFGDESLFLDSDGFGFEAVAISDLNKNDNNPVDIFGDGIAQATLTWETQVNNDEWVTVPGTAELNQVRDYRPQPVNFSLAQPGDNIAIRVAAVVDDEWGYRASLQSAPVPHIDRPPTGNLSIGLDITTFSAPASTRPNNVSDPDGVVSVLAYQWQSGTGIFFTDIPGTVIVTLLGTVSTASTTSRIYNVNPVDFPAPADSIRLLVRVTDPFFGLATITSNVAQVNFPASTTARITGDAPLAAGASYTLTGNIRDENGGIFPSYQWYVSFDNGTSYEIISVAIGKTYTAAPTIADSIVPGTPPILRNEITHSDNLGFVSLFTVDFTTNLLGTGAALINGAPSFTENEVYTANTDNIADGNGIGVFTHQWELSFDGGTSYSQISSATDSTYTIALTDFVNVIVGTPPQLRVSILHTDAAGFQQTFQATVIHTDREASGNLAIASAGFLTGDTVLADISGLTDADGALSLITYQWQTGINGVFVDVATGATDAIYTIQPDDFNSGDSLRLFATARDPFGGVTALASQDTQMDTTGTGVVVIEGAPSFADNEVYTANTDSVTDENGIGVFTHQWELSFDGGTSYSQISSATDSTYTIALTDFVDVIVGTPPQLRISVSHSNIVGFESAFHATVIHTEREASGILALTAAGLVAGDIISADISGLTDADGALSLINHQWLTRDFGSVLGTVATDTSYTINADDFKPANSLQLITTAEDPFGGTVLLTSEVLLINESTIGALTLTLLGGVLRLGATVSVLSGVSDANGGGFESYSWALNGVIVSSAVTDSYILQEADSRNGFLALNAVYADSLGFKSTLFLFLIYDDSTNAPVSGTVTFSGSPSFVPGERYTVSVDFDDPNGNDRLDFGVDASFDEGANYVRLTSYNEANVRGTNVHIFTLLDTQNDDLRRAFRARVDGGDKPPYSPPIMRVRVSHRDLANFPNNDLLPATLTHIDTPFRFSSTVPLRCVAESSTNTFGTICSNTQILTQKLQSNKVGIHSADFLSQIFTDPDFQYLQGTDFYLADYQWQEGFDGVFTNITGANSPNYVISDEDYTSIDSLRLVMTLYDDLGGASSPLTTQVVSLNVATQGNITLTLIDPNVIADGATVTLLTSGVSDENGGGFISYSWLLNGVTISGETGLSYVLRTGDVAVIAGGGLQARALYEDELTFTTTLSAPLTFSGGPGGPDGDDPGGDGTGNALGTGAVVIEGATSFAENEVYTANTDNIADDNGIGIFTHQWEVSFDGGTTHSQIASATDSTYTIALTDFAATPTALPPQLRVSVLHTDAAGFRQTFRATTNHTDRGTSGNLALTAAGLAAGDIVSANISGLTDIDGALSLITHQWQTGSDSGVFADVATGATDATYTIHADDFNLEDSLRLVATAQDPFGGTVLLTSEVLLVNANTDGALTLALSGANVIAAGATATLLTAGVSDANGGGFISYSWLLNNTLISGELGDTYILRTGDLTAVVDGNLQAVAIYEDGLTFTAPFAATLLFSGGGPGSGNPDVGNPDGDDPGGDGTGNALGTGAAVIDGAPSFAENEVYTANIDDIADDNGIGVFTHQWEVSFDGGADYSLIDSATDSTYTLALADFTAVIVGTPPQLQVSILHTDAVGFQQTFRATTNHTNRAASGNLAITAAGLQTGDIVSANIDGLTDADGALSLITHQWQTGINGGVFANVALGATYTIQANNFNPADSLRLLATSQDPLGGTTSLTSEILLVNINTNGALTLSLSGTGIVAAGATATLLTADVSDANDGNFISYSWLLNGTSIAGETGLSYVLRTGDLPAVARGNLQAIAVYEDGLTFTTTLSVALPFTGGGPGSGPGDPSDPGDPGGPGGNPDGDDDGGDGTGNALGTGAAIINGASFFAENEVYTANTDDIADENGIGVFTHQWEVSFDSGANYSPIASATDSTYTLALADFAAMVLGTPSQLRVSILHTDAAEFLQTFRATIIHANREMSGNLVITATGLQPGDIVSSNTDALMGANGISSFAHQWQTGSSDSSFVDITNGAAGATYTIFAADFNPADSLQLVATSGDPFGGTTSITSAILPVNRETQGNIALTLSGTGIIAAGATVTLLTAGVSDVNSGNFISYSWLLNSTAISGEDSDSYILRTGDLVEVASGRLQAIAVYEDGLAFAATLSTTLSFTGGGPGSGGPGDPGDPGGPGVGNPDGDDDGGGGTGNALGTGAAVIDGAPSFAENEVYTANTDGIADENGIGAFTHQWEVSFDTGTDYSPVAGATDSTYTITFADFTAAIAGTPPQLRVSVLHTDAAGFHQTFRATTIHTNREISGDLAITAAGLLPGNIVSADTSGLTDADGALSFTYQWQAGSNGGGFVDIASGATGATYTIHTDDFNPADSLRLVVTAQDPVGGIMSPLAAMLLINTEPQGNITLTLSGSGIIADGATVTLLTAGVSDENGGNFNSYSWLLNGTIISGETGDSYILRAGDLVEVATGRLQAIGVYEDNLAFVTNLSTTLSFTGGGPGGGNPGVGNPDGDDPGGGGTGNALGTGVAAINGSVSFAENNVYTANISDIADDNGLGIFTYQWETSFDGGINYSPIASATDSTYTLAVTDFADAVSDPSPQIQVSVLHTDAAGFRQTFRAVIINANSELSGDLSITATGLQPGDIVSADIDELMDENGALSFTYQWQAGNSSGSFADIPTGATDATYTIRADDFNPEDSLRLVAIAKDPVGGVMRPNSPILLINKEVQGNITLAISGANIVVAGATVTLLTASVSDENGGGVISHSWSLNGTLISGETSDSYILQAGDLVEVASGRLQAFAVYEDGLAFATNLSATLSFIGGGPGSGSPGDPGNPGNPGDPGGPGGNPDDDGGDGTGNALGTGAATIDGATSFADNEVYTANTDGIADDNGIGIFTYQWETSIDGGADYSPIASATDSTYTLSLTDFAAAILGIPPQMRVSILHTDAAGFHQTFHATIIHANREISGNLAITAAGLRAGDIVSALVSDSTGADGALSLFAYQWQTRSGTSVFVDITTDTTYTIHPNNFNPADSLRLIGVAQDAFGNIVLLTSQVLLINTDIDGALTLTLSGDNIVVAGATVTLLTTGVSDANGGNFISYSWLLNGAVITSETGDSYILREGDLVDVASGRLQAAAVYEDSLTFTATLSATLSFIGGGPGSGSPGSPGGPGGGDPGGPDDGNPDGDDGGGDGTGNALGTGAVIISGAAFFAENEVYTANTDNIADDNGIGVFTHQWEVSFDGGANYSQISSAADSTYTIALTDFAAVTALPPQLRVSVLHIDAAGFHQTFRATTNHTDRGTSGDLAITAAGLAAGDIVSANISGLTDADGALSLITHQWQTGSDSGVFTNIASGGTDATYAIHGNDFNPEDSLRLIATAQDTFGGTALLTSEVLFLNANTDGALTLTLSGTDALGVGVTVTLLTTGVSDANGGDFNSYLWFLDGVDIPGETSESYILQPDALFIAARGGLQALAFYEDGLTFTTTLSARLVFEGGGPSYGGPGDPGGPGGGTPGVGTPGVTDPGGGGTGNEMGTGMAVIDGAASFAENEVYTANIDDIADENGIGTFTYQWEVNFDGGTNYSLLTGATTPTYTLALTDFAAAVAAPPPQLRVSVSHIDAVGFSQAFLATVIHSDRVADGDLVITETGLMPGNIVSADTGGLTDADGVLSFDYQWQTGISGTNFVHSVGETAATYAINAVDFNPNDALRLLATGKDPFGGTILLTSSILAVNRDTTGGILLSAYSEIPVVGATVSIVTVNLSDENGEGAIAYSWFEGDTQIGSANDDTYILRQGNIIAATRGELRAELRYRDGLGFETVLSANIADTAESILQEIAAGIMTMNVLGYALDEDSATIQISGIPQDRITNISYIWRTGKGDAFANAQEIATGDSYVLLADDFNPHDSLQGIAQVNAISGDSFRFTSAIEPINFPPTGQIIITVMGGGAPIIGAVLSADMSRLSDVNGGLSVREHIWHYANITVRNGDETYTINANAIRAGTISYTGIYEDAAAFAATIRAAVNTVDRTEGNQIESVMAAINIATAHSIWNALKENFSAADGLWANNKPVDDASQIAEALANRLDDSHNPNSPLALDSFALKQSSGAEEGSRWSWWTHGALSHLEGDPIVGNARVLYDGRYSAFYAGMERQLSEKFRAGLAFGADSADINVRWPDSKNGWLRQNVRSLTPYVEWAPDENTAVRALASFGTGQLRVNTGNETIETGVQREIFGVRASHRVILKNNFDLIYSAGWDSVRTHADLVTLSGVNTQLESGHQEIHLDVETGHLSTLSHDGALRKFLNLSWRSQSGDLKEGPLYNLDGGINWSLPEHAFFGSLEAERQLSDGRHKHERLSARFSYGQGRISNSLETRYDSSQSLLHRWNIEITSESGVSEFHNGIYLEQHGARDFGFGLSMELEF